MRRGGFTVAATRGEQLVELPLQGEVLASWDAVAHRPDGIGLPGPGAAILRVAE